MIYQGASMTSFRLVCIAGLLALSACPGDDGGDDNGDTLGATTSPMSGTGMEEDSGTSAPSDDSSSGGGSTELSHADDIQPIWDEHCVEGCHEPGGTGLAWLDMSPAVAYGAIVDVNSMFLTDFTFVVPGDVESSYLWHKIQGTHIEFGGTGGAMPAARSGEDPTVITPEQYQTIEDWIAGGAPE